MDIPILIGKPQDSAPKTVEVCRSFQFTLSHQFYGGNQYESTAFFASRKMVCNLEDVDWISQQIYEECVTEVRTAAAGVIAELKQRSRRTA